MTVCAIQPAARCLENRWDDCAGGSYVRCRTDLTAIFRQYG